MSRLNAKQKKEFFIRMESYYNEEELQKLFNIVDCIEEDREEHLSESYSAIKALSLRDRHTCIALAEIYDKINAHFVIDQITMELNSSIFDELKEYVKESKIDEYFQEYKDLDYFILRKTIDDDGRYMNPLLGDKESQLLKNIIDYKLGIKKRILRKPITKIGVQKVR